MEILIDDRHNEHPIRHEAIEKKARIILKALESPNAELSILIVGDEQIGEFNKTYLGRSGPTNVIAFPMREGPFGDVAPDMLGDVVISIDTALREASEADLTVETRFDQLLIHGILHLCGYDHEQEVSQAMVMKAKEEELFALLS